MRGEIRKISIIIAIALPLLINLFQVTKVSAEESFINCQAHEGKCTLPVGKNIVTLEILPRPVTAMRDSTFIVTFSGKLPEKFPYLDLGMPAMKMGPNRVQLTPDGNGIFKGKGVIVRCKSGRRTWFANVVLPGTGEAKFVFDVVY